MSFQEKICLISFIKQKRANIITQVFFSTMFVFTHKKTESSVCWLISQMNATAGVHTSPGARPSVKVCLWEGRVNTWSSCTALPDELVPTTEPEVVQARLEPALQDLECWLLGGQHSPTCHNNGPQKTFLIKNPFRIK